MQKSSFELEKKLYKRGYDFVVGIDEAGRGPLAGPVVAAATTVRNFQFSIFPPEADQPRAGNSQSNSNSKKNPSYELLVTSCDLIRDSKTLSEKQREGIYGFIMENFFVGVGICDHQTIDRMNILQASFLAMKAAITNLKLSNSKQMILVDGDKKIPNFSGEQIAIPRGDQKIKSISAASIIAKVTRDRIMREAHKKYPRYGFDRHKGYGTKLHMEMLRKYGPCEIHRRSFKPVGKFFG